MCEYVEKSFQLTSRYRLVDSNKQITSHKTKPMKNRREVSEFK